MIKHYCDICNKEIHNYEFNKIDFSKFSLMHRDYNKEAEVEACEDCYKKMFAITHKEVDK